MRILFDVDGVDQNDEAWAGSLLQRLSEPSLVFLGKFRCSQKFTRHIGTESLMSLFEEDFRLKPVMTTRQVCRQIPAKIVATSPYLE